MQHKHDVVFATPCLTNNLSVEFLVSALETDRLLIANGLIPAWMQIGLDPYLAKVRCKLMTKFLDDFPGVENFFFIDDDIGWPAQKAMEFITNPNPVLACIYPKKQANIDFPVVLAGVADTGGLIEAQGFVLAKEVPTGFLRLKRSVLEKLADGAPKFKDIVDGKVVWFTEFCKMGLDGLNADGWWVGEDYDLSRRIAAAGFDIWVDPKISFTHRGGKVWRDCLADHLQKFGVVESKKEAAE